MDDDVIDDDTRISIHFMARLHRVMFEEYLAEGFTPEQATRFIVANINAPARSDA